MLISGHKADSVYRRYHIIDMAVVKTATAEIEEARSADDRRFFSCLVIGGRTTSEEIV
jgi:hypothetical protein